MTSVLKKKYMYVFVFFNSCFQDAHYTIFGHGPSSVLQVTSESLQKHYGTYTCKAENPYGKYTVVFWISYLLSLSPHGSGKAFHNMKLFEADEPRDVQVSCLDMN